MKYLLQARFLYISIALILALGVAVGASIVGGSSPAPDTQRGTPADAAVRDLRGLLIRTEGKPSASDLLAFESSHAGTRAAALARFLRGFLAAGAKDWQGALVALDAGEIDTRTALGDFAALYRGRALAALGRNADAERVLDDVAKKYPDSLVLRDAALEAAKAAVAAGDANEALENLKPLADAGDGQALTASGDIVASRGDSARAVAFYRYAYFYDPAAPSATAALGQLRALGADPEAAPATEDELLTRANKLFAAQRWSEASAAYGRLLTLHPGARDRERLLVRRGTAAVNARDLAGATSSLPLVTNRDAELHAEALYQLAVGYRRAGQGDQFEATGNRLRTLHPKSEWTGRFLADYVDYLESNKRSADIYAAQRALISGFPLNDAAAKTSYELAWNRYTTNDFRGAAQLFEEHLATFRTPQSKWIGEAAFWGGRSYERLGNIPRALFLYKVAHDRYPYGYHGHVAQNRIKRLTAGSPSAKAEVPKPGSPLARARENALAVQPIVETADNRVEPRFRRATDLEAVQLWELANAELAEAAKLFPTSPRVALRYARTFRERGDNYQATLILRKGYPDVYSYREDQMPREAWEIMFPLTNWDTIKRQAAANGLDPYIVAGLIRQESVFNPRALSRANARGMMQLLPSTGRLVARTRGISAPSPADLYNPTLNITLGASYLAQQMQKFGRIELAAAAYNAGPGRVVQWQAQRSIDPIEEWVESIPFSETRGYVQGVIRYAANYRRFYGGSAERETSAW